MKFVSYEIMRLVIIIIDSNYYKNNTGLIHTTIILHVYLSGADNYYCFYKSYLKFKTIYSIQ